ncbi:MAG: hypothetical protein ACE5D1_04175, partial [Fidelibacterota bacterium]
MKRLMGNQGYYIMPVVFQFPVGRDVAGRAFLLVKDQLKAHGLATDTGIRWYEGVRFTEIGRKLMDNGQGQIATTFIDKKDGSFI